jgi:hypothetical protein
MSSPSTSSWLERSTDLLWKRLWALPLPAKIQHFLWRLTNNSLPLRMKLRRRGVELDTRCPVCYRLDEDGGHCFLKCKSVKALRRAAQMEETRQLLVNCPNAQSVMYEIFQCDEETCLKTCVLLWLWWSVFMRPQSCHISGPSPTVGKSMILLLQFISNEHRT